MSERYSGPEVILASRAQSRGKKDVRRMLIQGAHLAGLKRTAPEPDQSDLQAAEDR